MGIEKELVERDAARTIRSARRIQRLLDQWYLAAQRAARDGDPIPPKPQLPMARTILNAAEKARDRLYGKPKQQIELTGELDIVSRMEAAERRLRKGDS